VEPPVCLGVGRPAGKIRHCLKGKDVKTKQEQGVSTDHKVEQVIVGEVKSPFGQSQVRGEVAKVRPRNEKRQNREENVGKQA
jgi:hypothetical protein